MGARTRERCNAVPGKKREIEGPNTTVTERQWQIGPGALPPGRNPPFTTHVRI
jgi:hypothetical protein